MLRVTGRALPVVQTQQNATTTGYSTIEAFNNLTNYVRIRAFGSAANNALNLGGSGAAAAASNNLSAQGRLDIFTVAGDDLILGTNTVARTTWAGATGNITHAANFTLATTKTLSAGANTLIGSIADKLNAVHLAIASQAIGDLLVADAATTFARLPDVAIGSVLASGGVGALPAYTATPTLTSLGLASGTTGAPSLYHATGGDTNTGLSFAADTIYNSVGGTDRTKLISTRFALKFGAAAYTDTNLFEVTSDGADARGLFITTSTTGVGGIVGRADDPNRTATMFQDGTSSTRGVLTGGAYFVGVSTVPFFGTLTGQDAVFGANDTEFARMVNAGAWTFKRRASFGKGADVASGTTITLGADGNYFHITGTTQIDLITSTNWQAGSVVFLKFNESVTVRHNQAPSGAGVAILLAGAANFAATADDTLTLVYDGTTFRELARTVI